MRELILQITKNDLRIESFRPGGAGGQHRDKTSNAVRITHKDSGAQGQSQDSRSRSVNLRTAFRRMTDSSDFQKWLRSQLPTIEVAPQPERRYTYRPPNIDLEHRTLQER